MSEENKETIETGELVETADVPPKANRKMLLIALAALGLVALGGLAIYLFRGRTGGRVVPAPRTVTFDENTNQNSSMPAGEQTITLTPEQVAGIGLKTEAVGETMAAEASGAAATGVVGPSAYRETPVSSLVGGVVRRVDAELGRTVGKGQTLAVVFSDELAAAQSRYLTLQTDASTARQNYERAAKLQKLNPVGRGESDEAEAKLKTKTAELDEARRRYERTVKLVGIGAASREELEQDRTKLRTAEAETEQARKQLARASEVARLNPVGNGELEQAALKLRTAEAEFANARQRLLLLGFSEERVGALRSPSQITSEIALKAPVAGTVTARSANPGEVVEAGKEIFKVTDLSTVWVIAQVFEKDLGKIRTGTGASVTSDAYPGRLFRGQVTYLDPNVNPETRTAQARVELDNPGGIFKLGMYVNVTFGALGTAEKTVPSVASGAVQTIDNRPVVFAATDRPNVFVMKTVRLGAEKDGQFPVLEGLTVGEKVVTDGSFLLRAELLKQK